MKQAVLVSILFFFLLCFAQGQQSVSRNLVGQQPELLQDSLRSADSIPPASPLDSLDSVFKYTEIIPGLRKDNNFLIQQLQQQLQAGRHDLLYSLDPLQASAQEKNLTEGQAKGQRPIWVLLVVFILFLILAVLRLIFPVEIRTIVDAYYKERLLLQVSKEDNLATSWPYIFLYLLFSLSLGLFIVLLMSGFSDKNYLTFENFLKNSLFVGILFVAKIVIIRFVSFIFSLEKIVREYVAVLYLVYFNSMFFLMPFLLTVVFVPVKYFQLISIIYIILIVILFSYRFLRTAFHLFANFKFSIFYLILYLCSLELAPILILVRALSK